MRKLLNFTKEAEIKKIDYLLIGIILCLAFLLSSYCLRYNPSSWFDEGIYIQISNNLYSQGMMAVQSAPGEFTPLALISVGYPVYYTASVFYKVFGTGFIQARFAAIFFLLLFIFFFYLLNKKLYKGRVAFLSTLLLLFFAPLYGNGRNLLGDIPGLLFMSIGLLGYLYWEKSDFKNNKPAIFSGLAFGLAVATKPNFLVLGGGILLALFLNRKILKSNLKQLGLFLISGLIPFVWWIVSQFTSISVIQRVFEHYANPYANESVSSLFIPNLIKFFTETTPLHFTLLGMVLLISIIFRIKNKTHITGTEIIIYFFILFTFLSFLRTPGWYRYFFLAHIWLIFLFPHAVETITNYIIKRRQLALYASIIITLLLIGVGSVHLVKTGLSCRESSVDRASKFMLEWTKPSDKPVMFINTPELVARISNNNYSQYLEINPTIKFGKNELQKIERGVYNQIILMDNDLNPVTNNLQCYNLDKNIGRYKFYQKKNICK